MKFAITHDKETSGTKEKSFQNRDKLEEGRGLVESLGESEEELELRVSFRARGGGGWTDG